jgi:hypothetical protein
MVGNYLMACPPMAVVPAKMAREKGWRDKCKASGDWNDVIKVDLRNRRCGDPVKPCGGKC